MTAKRVVGAPQEDRVRQALPCIRSAYDRTRVAVVLECLASEDMTRQSHKDECDINFMMARFERTGVLPSARDSVPQFGDVTGLDFMTSAQQVAEVKGAFSMLDARTRARFENDPVKMLDFLSDERNMEEAIKLGLVAKPKEDSDGSRKAVAGAGSVGQVGAALPRFGESGSGSVGGDSVASGVPAVGESPRAGGSEGGQGRKAAVGA